MTGLTTKQRDALLVVQELRARTGQSPTWEDIRGELGLATKAGVNRVLRCLRERGRIDWHPSRGGGRSTIVVLAPLPMPEDFAVEITPAGRRALAESA